MDKIKRMKYVDSPFDKIGNQMKTDKEFDNFLSENKDVVNYDLFWMTPKVTYDDWVVCLYEKNGRLYRIDEESIIEVQVMEILEYNEDFQVIKENGEPMTDHEFFVYCNGDELCAGEADDTTCYVYFKEVI